MSEKSKQQTVAEEECGDQCVVDTAALKARFQQQKDQPKAWSALILLSHGTYGHWDDAFSALQVGNAVLAIEEAATMLLVGDGVYLAVKGQDPKGLGLMSNIHYIQDFLDLGGRMVALQTSLDKRGLSEEDLLDGVKVITSAQMSAEVAGHNVSVTF